MTGIVVLVSVVFLWSAHRRFDALLREASGARLASSASLLARMIQDGVPAARATALRLGALPPVRAALTVGEDSVELAAALSEAIRGTRGGSGTTTGSAVADSTLLRIRLLDTSGVVRHVTAFRNDAVASPWAEGARLRGALSPTLLTFSPILDANGRAQVEYVVPVHARPEGESLVGWLIETRAIRGRGVDAVRQLIGNGTLLIGQPDAGVWSDLERVVPGPPAIAHVDSVFSFAESPRGPGIGVSRAIRGTPWVIWLQLSDAQLLAPRDAFLRQQAPFMAIIAALGAFIAWSYSRRLTTRIVGLTARVDRMAAVRGDGDVPAPPAATPARGAPARARGTDEIDRLAAAFALMAERARAQQELEARLQQSQKLEAVGRLAGGIAHDFNNVLTVVTNFSEIVQNDLVPGSDAARDLDQILLAAHRASRLTRQLLAFSRRQILQPVKLDLNDAVRSAYGMLERLIPSRVAITMELSDGLSAVLADPVQIEQVLLNLAVNASDAMPEGGTLIFRTSMSALDEPGPDDDESRMHVCLAVRDTGVGMDRATVARIFEPFYTTKPVGKGTGLGLATVHGIVTQLGGRVWVYSEPGHGTTFKLFFPAIDGGASPVETTPRRAQLPPGVGTILLVEDDPATREVTRRQLARQGYTVLEAPTANHALTLLEGDRAAVQLVLTDVMMPGMNGLEFARLVAARWPELPLLVMSGYADVDIIKDSEDARFTFLEKPFTSATLLGAVATALLRSRAAE